MNFKELPIGEKLYQKPKKWLVTGAAGFIGSHLVEELLNLGQTVVGVDNFITGRKINLDELKELVSPKFFKNLEFVEGDITEKSTALKVTRGVDAVLHNAALGSVPRSILDPNATNHHNVTGFVQIAHAAHENGVKRFVYASSSSVYGDNQDLPKKEEKTGKPLSPYAASKKTNEIYADAFGNAYSIEMVGIRYFNVFGSRQDPKGVYAAVIPKWIDLLKNEGKISIFGDGKTSRDFCFVKNVVYMNLLAASTENPNAIGQVFNAGCGEQTTLTQLFEILRTEVSRFRQEVSSVEASYEEFRPGDVRHSLASIEKAESLLGYKPLVYVRDGLKQTVESFF